ncbi:hypothetical protein [Pengzhenrongella sicca]|uniref:Uncharacterized protein n=1 Tax=Pengzhenrongella sicca TaxID=2819238 RepID=A0A8A4ZJD6_9MICO|nr:hypothetical protein [Pengzhenrongella sicca]QTE31153.1 hypothetical protein J4E96_09635 [Pengzhenrongella sicca]
MSSSRDGEAAGAPVRRRPRLLRWGLPRDAAAGQHVAGFFVATVVTVLLTRGLLAAAGYPQVGGNGLHIAHVLWGGVLMALAFVLLLSFAGPVVRPLGALVGGVGFGLFVDEIGKFVTSDSNYFYEPTAALIYGVVVALLLVGEALQGRTAPRGPEALAGAVDHLVAGVAGGLSPRARDAVRGLLADAGDAPGADEVRALVAEVEDDADELPDPIGAVARWVVAASRRVVRRGWAPWVAVTVLTVTGLLTVGRGLLAWVGGRDDVPAWVVLGMVVSGLVSFACSVLGLARVRSDARTGYEWFRRSVLISLLVTQICLFRLDQWAAVVGLALDLVVLAVVAAELTVMQAGDRRR